MHALAAVAEPIAVIAPFHDVQEPARRPGVGVVIHREKTSELVEAQTERVPEAGGDVLEFRAVGPAPIDIAAFAAAGQGRPIAADQPIVGSQVLTEPEIDIIPGIERKPGEPVVRIIAGVSRRTMGVGRRSGETPSALPSPSRSASR